MPCTCLTLDENSIFNSPLWDYVGGWKAFPQRCSLEDSSDLASVYMTKNMQGYHYSSVIYMIYCSCSCGHRSISPHFVWLWQRTDSNQASPAEVDGSSLIWLQVHILTIQPPSDLGSIPANWIAQLTHHSGLCYDQAFVNLTLCPLRWRQNLEVVRYAM